MASGKIMIHATKKAKTVITAVMLGACVSVVRCNITSLTVEMMIILYPRKGILFLSHLTFIYQVMESNGLWI